jgi:hypothetical protein
MRPDLRAVGCEVQVSGAGESGPAVSLPLPVAAPAPRRVRRGGSPRAGKGLALRPTRGSPVPTGRQAAPELLAPDSEIRPGLLRLLRQLDETVPVTVHDGRLDVMARTAAAELPGLPGPYDSTLAASATPDAGTGCMPCSR